MLQAIEYKTISADTMVIGARKKQSHSTFVFVHQGAALIRLGKQEIPVSVGQGFWLPVNCLNALTILKGSLVSTLDFSVRSTVSLPLSAGFVSDIRFVEEIITQLTKRQSLGSNDWSGPYGRLLRCVRDYLSTVQPNDKYSADIKVLIKTIDRLAARQELSAEESKSVEIALGFEKKQVQTQLVIREWVRQRKSGQSNAKIAAATSLNEKDIAALLEEYAGFI
ncbi:hypothetical protein AT251_11860 [Enterovibrio nigricans]|uniref:AraC family transcriptional regulator n=2 Tax=Enterovibrio nigricans TaxID=504469 RepID=A0A1T4V536_9GAMM|nr:hypothetical protein AT251_11860 [Enterovibrio nigricans]SKA60130.1 hypothetical protein SAMN02745132_03245 [Enterovibrio nigricans DSM 22720]